MVLVLEPLGDNLQELLGVLLLPAYALLKSDLEDADKGERGDGLFGNGALVEVVEHLLEALGDEAVLHALDLPHGQLLAVGLDEVGVDGGVLDAAAVRLADEVDAELTEAGEGLEDRVDEAVIGLVAEADNGLFARVGRLVVEGKGRAKDVYQRGGGEGSPGGVRDHRGLVGHGSAVRRGTIRCCFRVNGDLVW